MRIDWHPKLRTRVDNDAYNEELREPRRGVMIHYDGSGTDAGAVAWFGDPRCRVSYQLLVLDDGSYARIAPDTARAWHAGYCRTSDPTRLPYSDANSAFYAISAATDDGHDVTPLQTLGIAWLVRQWFHHEGWDPSETWRIVGHASEAVYGPNHDRAGERGRKTDPEGTDPDNPILAVEDIRTLVPLLAPSHLELL